jgi:flagellar hook-associated protein 3 FlgL
MTLRIANSTTNRNTLEDLNSSRSRLNALSQQISTGQRITSLSSDPSGSALLVNFQDSIDRNMAMGRQIESANGMLQATSDSIDSLNTGITQLLELGQRGLNGTAGAAARASLAKETDGVRSNFLSVGNTQVQGKYIFAGSRTTTLPFVDDAAHQTVAYQGNSSTIAVKLGQTASVDTNVTGDTLFQGPGGQGSSTDLMKAVTDLRDGLNANDTAKIQAAYDNLKTIQVRISGVASDVGSRQSTMTSLKTGLETATAGLQSIQSSIQSVDLPSAITQYTAETVGQQATMKVMAKLSSTNLFDYIS